MSAIVRVLVVEDHPSMRASLRAVLETEGLDVLEAADGRSALAAAGEADVVLLDLQVPVVPGDEVLRRLRADPATAALPVVVVTATGAEGRRPALALGADAYLTKPFGPDALMRTIARVLPSDEPSAG